MIPTPDLLLPLVNPIVVPLREALRGGLGWASYLQPDSEDLDSWFFSHSARHYALKELKKLAAPGQWAVVDNVPNSGIHIRLGDLHIVRVLRSEGGTTPHPGGNRARRRAWTNPMQGRLFLDTSSGQPLPPLTLIADWQDEDGEPVIHLGLPNGIWDYAKNPRLHWRIPFPGEGLDLNSLRFDGGGGDGEAPILLKVHESEKKFG